jgi:anthranilate phosphoribosyltransferase
MAGKCRVCDHGERAAIDKAIVTRSASLRTIADRYGVSKTALIRHRDSHIPKLVQAAESARAMQAVSSGAALVDELDRLLKKALAILEAAEKAGELKVALQAIREARETIKACADLAVTVDLEERVEALEAQIEARRGGMRGG